MINTTDLLLAMLYQQASQQLNSKVNYHIKKVEKPDWSKNPNKTNQANLPNNPNKTDMTNSTNQTNKTDKFFSPDSKGYYLHPNGHRYPIDFSSEYNCKI